MKSLIAAIILGCGLFVASASAAPPHYHGGHHAPVYNHYHHHHHAPAYNHYHVYPQYRPYYQPYYQPYRVYPYGYNPYGYNPYGYNPYGYNHYGLRFGISIGR